MITVVGEVLVDLIEHSPGQPVAYPGGSPANVAVALARLGRPVNLLTQLGDDPYGRLLLAHLRDNGVELAPGSRLDSAPTSTARTKLDADGHASYAFDISWRRLTAGADQGTAAGQPGTAAGRHGTAAAGQPGTAAGRHGTAAGGQPGTAAGGQPGTAAGGQPGTAGWQPGTAGGRHGAAGGSDSAAGGQPDSAAATCVHTGSLAAMLAPGADDVAAVVRAARETSMVSFDPNCRPSVIGDPAIARERVAALVAVSDIVKVSLDDLAWLYPGRSYRDVGRDWLDQGAGLVVVTLGGDGAWALAGHPEAGHPEAGRCEVAVDAYPVEVVDTVGAGDAFTAGLLSALDGADLLGAARRPALAAIDAATLTDVLLFASRVAAATCARHGADPPTPADLPTPHPPGPSPTGPSPPDPSPIKGLGTRFDL
ncbi:carbohydrate kinase [Actinomycetes bacterium KLBMP 9797]